MSRFSTIEAARWLTEVGSFDPAARHAAMRSFADTIAAMRAGATHPAAQRVLAALAEDPVGHCAVIGSAIRLAPEAAALANGTAAHAQELDDNFLPAGTHASAVVVPALLALGEARDIGGLRVLDAYIASLQVQWRLSQFVNPEHGEAGWHPTSTVGAIGAAAACAYLLALPGEQTEASLGLAASMASGTRAQFGYHAKPLHAGLAARAGILATQLASAGVTASPQAIEADDGFFALAGGPAERELAAMDFGEPLALTHFGVNMKPWPTCGSTHPAIHAVLEARQIGGAGDITEIRVAIPEVLADNLRFPDPATADEAKFSLEFAVAVAAVDGELSLQSLEGTSLQRSDLRQTMQQVVRHVVPNNYDDLRVTVELHHADGRITRGESGFADVPGSLNNPLSDRQLVARLAGEDFELQGAQRLWAAIAALEADGPISGIAEALVPN